MRRDPEKATPRFLDGLTEPAPFCRAHPDRCIHLQQIAALGGAAIVRSRGRAYCRALGKAGFERYAAVYFGGDRSAAAASLRGRGKLGEKGHDHARRH